MIYLDHNATTPPHPDVLAAMVEAARSAWANPASVHGPGRRARALVEEAREAVARLVGMHPRDVTLASGGTEANNLALSHVVAAAREGATPALVAGRIEHPSVVRAAERLAERGVVVEWAEAAPSGVVEEAAVSAAIERASRRGTVRLVSVQAVNHETGVVHPIERIAETAHRAGAALHVDAVQAAGRLPPSVWAGADLVTISGHKLRGPKGIGALAVRPGIRLEPVMVGGAQERGLRPGTQDPIACAGLAVAAERARTGPGRYAALARLRDRLEAALVELGRAVGSEPVRNGDALRAPHVTNLSWPGWSGPELCAALDLAGVAVSSGSACSAGTMEPSPVIVAMAGVERARSAVRVSLGEDTTDVDVDGALRVWRDVLARVPVSR